MQTNTSYPESHQEMIDTFEQATVDYMAGKRGLTEQQFRALIHKDVNSEVYASYRRKIARLVVAAHAKGFTPAKFHSALLHKRQHSWAYSPDAGPQRPASEA